MRFIFEDGGSLPPPPPQMPKRMAACVEAVRSVNLNYEDATFQNINIVKDERSKQYFVTLGFTHAGWVPGYREGHPVIVIESWAYLRFMEQHIVDGTFFKVMGEGSHFADNGRPKFELKR